MAVVLVTGSSSGIGLATALHFVQLGHEVYAGVRTPSTATELGAAAERERGLHVVTLDVDDAAAVTRAAGDVLDRTLRIDVLVNNAGIGGDRSPTSRSTSRSRCSRRTTSGRSG
jgi:NAD(P)-dependent dehydrogenase (short-subunit alcohol dehydrogenase family)